MPKTISVKANTFQAAKKKVWAETESKHGLASPPITILLLKQKRNRWTFGIYPKAGDS